MMKISPGSMCNPVTISKERSDLMEGQIPKLASKQVDQVDAVNFKGTRENHRLSFRYNKDLGKNVAHVIDNATGKTVKHTPTDTEVDHMIRVKRLVELKFDKKA